MATVTVGNMRTMGDEPKVNLEYEDSYGIAKGFPTADDTILPGQIVKLLSTGLVAKVTAVTDVPLGVVVSSFAKTSAGTVRVLMPVNAIASGAIADGVVATGALLAASGVDANGYPKFKVAVATNYVCAIALKGGADTTIIQVGLLTTPMYLPKA